MTSVAPYESIATFDDLYAGPRGDFISPDLPINEVGPLRASVCAQPHAQELLAGFPVPKIEIYDATPKVRTLN